MKNWISKKIDIEIYSDFSFAKHIRVLFMGKQIAHFLCSRRVVLKSKE